MSEQANISEQEREAKLRELAGELHFEVSKTGALFTLSRTADVKEPVIESNLTLAQAEELLKTWKLRGFHGG